MVADYVQFALILAKSLTVAVHCLKKPFIYTGFDNLIQMDTVVR